MKRKFHNPYNFVPAIPREYLGDSELGDREPSGHDRYLSDKYSGKLRVRMRVETPLLLPDTAMVGVGEIGDSNHKSFPVRVDADGKPEINPTAIKGMLRSAYEAVTNSRLSVFADHDERLAFRMVSTEGAMSVPARIENGKVVLYTGTSKISNEGRPLNDAGKKENATLCAAWLSSYDTDTCRVSRNSITVVETNKPPEHGKEYHAWIEKFQHYRKIKRDGTESWIMDFKYWKVRSMSLHEDKLASKPTVTTETKVGRNSKHEPVGEGLEKVKGYVCVTGKNDGNNPSDARSNIENKHDERLFFGRSDEVNLPPMVRKEWDRLIKDYRLVHDDGNGKLEDPPKAKKRGLEIPLQWSRHIRQTKKSETGKESELKIEALKNEVLCYARVKRQDKGYEVLELYPVTISRRLHKVTPTELLPRELRPATDAQRLSPADRVFGWVRQGKGGGKDSGKEGAYRGQIRVDFVECKSDKDGSLDSFNNALPLNILGQPKPQQGRFYVARNKVGDAQPKVFGSEAGISTEEAGYKLKANFMNADEEKSLRGHKVYPHHNNLPNDYWDNPTEDRTQRGDQSPFFQEYRRPRNEKGQDCDNQNRSIQGWIKPGARFEFDIHVTNLSKVELGALVWLFRMREDSFHRLGGGKPLGFGSVHLSVIEQESEVNSGEELKKRYESLEDSQPGRCDLSDCVKEFKKAVWLAYGSGFREIGHNESEEDYQRLIEKEFGGISFIEGFLRAAKGFDDKLPIHYPRTREEGTTGHPAPNPEGESFRWFVENAKEAQQGVRHGYALGNLVDDPGLPILEHRADRQRARQQQNRQGQRGNHRGGRRR